MLFLVFVLLIPLVFVLLIPLTMTWKIVTHVVGFGAVLKVFEVVVGFLGWMAMQSFLYFFSLLENWSSPLRYLQQLRYTGAC
jgi:hypothetical protein